MVHSDEVRRRDFLKGVGVAAATSSVVAAQDSHQKSSSVIRDSSRRKFAQP